jgi:hypothetical protein
VAVTKRLVERTFYGKEIGNGTFSSAISLCYFSSAVGILVDGLSCEKSVDVSATLTC